MTQKVFDLSNFNKSFSLAQKKTKSLGRFRIEASELFCIDWFRAVSAQPFVYILGNAIEELKLNGQTISARFGRSDFLLACCFRPYSINQSVKRHSAARGLNLWCVLQFIAQFYEYYKWGGKTVQPQSTEKKFFTWSVSVFWEGVK